MTSKVQADVHESQAAAADGLYPCLWSMLTYKNYRNYNMPLVLFSKITVQMHNIKCYSRSLVFANNGFKRYLLLIYACFICTSQFVLATLHVFSSHIWTPFWTGQFSSNSI